MINRQCQRWNVGSDDHAMPRGVSYFYLLGCCNQWPTVALRVVSCCTLLMTCVKPHVTILFPQQTTLYISYTASMLDFDCSPIVDLSSQIEAHRQWEQSSIHKELTNKHSLSMTQAARLGVQCSSALSSRSLPTSLL